MAKLTREAFVEEVRRVATALGGTPLSKREFLERSGLKEHLLFSLFPDGGWLEAARLAGLPKHPAWQEPRSDEDLLSELHRVVVKLKSIPTWAKFRSESDVSSETIRKRFGGTRGTLERYAAWLAEREPESPMAGLVRSKLSGLPSSDEEDGDEESSHDEHEQSAGEPVARVRSPARAAPSPQGAPIYEALRAQGLHFPNELVTTYLLSLKTKPFVILSGISGTGKTKLAQAVAEWAGSETKVVDEEPTIDAGSGWVFRANTSALNHGILHVARGNEQLLELPDEGTVKLPIRYDGESFEGGVGKFRWRSSARWDIRLGALLRARLAREVSLGDFLKVRVERAEPTRQELVIERVHVEHRARTEVVRRHDFISVRPDWLDGKEVLGFYNVLTEEYVARPFLRLLLRAGNEPAKPFFAILDEMNLARVEHYFADMLSAMESRALDAETGDVRQEALHLHDVVENLPLDDDGEDGLVVPSRLEIPPNVYVTGTVNVDETTHAFSPKVLDRANTIEFNHVDLVDYGREDDDTSFMLKDGRIELGPCAPATQEDFKAAHERVRTTLVRLNAILKAFNLHFGYRVANEIALFVNNAQKHVEGEADAVVATALDFQVLQKILPKLHGPKQRLLAPLWSLLNFAAGGESGEFDDAKLRTLEERIKSRDARVPMPRSGRKLARMIRTLREQGFVSFIE